MKINNEIRFKVTSEQHDRIKSLAEKIGLTIKKYILLVALNSQVEMKIKPRE